MSSNTTPKKKNKRKRASEGTPPDKAGKKLKDKSECITCHICEDPILEPTDHFEGQDAVFCEGICNSWLHRKCVGLTHSIFDIVCESEDPYLCPYCVIAKQSKEILVLRQQVEILMNKLSIQLPQLPESVPPANQTAPMESEPQPTLVQNATASNIPANKKPNTSSISPSDRKFNILLYGIKECPSTQTRPQRMKSDLQNALQELSSLNDSINANSIKDIFRLGKFNKDQNRPRPLLIKFLRATDAFSVLANSNQLKSPVSIKPDKPPEEREIDKILLGVRWSLIQKGTDRKSIKIRNKCLYVNNDFHGKIENGTFRCISTKTQSSMENVNADTKPSSSPNTSPLLNSNTDSI